MMAFERCIWLNEPGDWQLQGDRLTVTTDAKTDFWRETHYGFIHDSGHFFGCRTSGDFTAELRVQAHYRDLYDQAGLMVRVDDACWIKAGLEMSDGLPMLSSVLTVGKSDWSAAPYGQDAGDFRVRVSLQKGALRLQVSSDGVAWPLSRLCPFPAAREYLVGPMCCTPERAGLRVAFSGFRVGPPARKELHDLS